ncbi:hypothetical protein NPIL_125841 [Nephila pilipes]|uniref:Uncharacterized protein n=1 Tax=Nephila pilipes TaxID=299642 RepID=A0A8X6PFH0_NEPPI|nr:hypothetical protein NPIL_125841 [Nephila pilipes]
MQARQCRGGSSTQGAAENGGKQQAASQRTFTRAWSMLGKWQKHSAENDYHFICVAYATRAGGGASQPAAVSAASFISSRLRQRLLHKVSQPAVKALQGVKKYGKYSVRFTAAAMFKGQQRPGVR